MRAEATDPDGFRPNVGIILCNQQGGLLWAKRAGRSGWQFPQGGIRPQESPEQALFRELKEEVGLTEADVTVISRTAGWLRYRLPQRHIRRNETPLVIGQKQLWFLLGLKADETRIVLDGGSDEGDEPEFDDWRWVDYWYPADNVIRFKRGVYRKALRELEGSFKDYQLGD